MIPPKSLAASCVGNHVPILKTSSIGGIETGKSGRFTRKTPASICLAKRRLA